MTRRKRRTISVSLDTRGQTTQDFALGIGIFLIAVASVYSTVPSLLSPYDTSVGVAETNQADRLAGAMLDTLTESTDRNELDIEAFNETFVNDPEGDNLTETLALRVGSGDHVFDRVNVTLETFDGEPITNTADQSFAAGDVYDSDRPSRSGARIVTVDDVSVLEESEACEPACRLVVRVW